MHFFCRHWTKNRRLNCYARSWRIDLLMYFSIYPETRINHLQLLLYCHRAASERCQSGKSLLHSSEIKALYRAEKAILLSLLHSSSAASCHSLGAFLSMISIYRTQEVLRWLQEVSQHRVPKPSRTKSLSCHLDYMLSPRLLTLMLPWTRGISQGGMLSACISNGFIAI